MRVWATLLAASALIACGREKAPVSGQPSGSASSPAGGTPSTAGPWDNVLGAVIATPSIENGAAVLFVRDTGSTSDLVVELFNHEDRTTRATLSPLAHRGSCVWERAGVLAGTTGQPSMAVWSLALEPGVATPIAIDGITELLPRDSAALAARIHRLVSALPDDSTSTPFRGLPIVVRDAWLVRLEDSSTVAIAVAMRALNVESDPRAEVTTIIVELDPAAGAAAWRTGFAQRVAGPEDRVEGADLLAAFRLHGGREAVAFAHESEKGLRVDVVERMAPGTWRVRWSSATLPCAR